MLTKSMDVLQFAKGVCIPEAIKQNTLKEIEKINNMPFNISKHSLIRAKERLNPNLWLEVLEAIQFYQIEYREALEIKTDSTGKPLEILTRFGLNAIYNLTLVITCDNKTIKTLWINKKTDMKKTLDIRRYITPLHWQQIKDKIILY